MKKLCIISYRNSLFFKLKNIQLRSIFFCLLTAMVFDSMAQVPTITSFSPQSGSVGTLVSITGTNLNSLTSISIGGIAALPISNNGTKLVAMVMPSSVSGVISITTSSGSVSSAESFSLESVNIINGQTGSKFSATGNIGNENLGSSVCLSADGNTAIIGAPGDNSNIGAAWIFIKQNNAWIQQSKLVGSGSVGASYQGRSVSISADGNTAVVGGEGDNNGQGAVWVFIRSNNMWFQQGQKLVGSGSIGMSQQGWSVSISADGNTLLFGGKNDNAGVGGFWFFTRSNGVWSQQGGKLVGSGYVGLPNQGHSVSISADGNTAMVGGNADNSEIGACWIFTRSNGVWSQQGGKLVGSAYVGRSSQGSSVALSADGNTAIVGAEGDSSSIGAAWIFTRSNGVWSQQGSKLVGTGFTGPVCGQGRSVSITADGNIAILGGPFENGSEGAAWIFIRQGGVWRQSGNKLFGSSRSGIPYQAMSLSISADGSSLLLPGPGDNLLKGSVWSFQHIPPPVINRIIPGEVKIGGLVTISGVGLSSLIEIKIGSVNAIPITYKDTQVVAMVMPGTSTGHVFVSTSYGAVTSSNALTLKTSLSPNSQQGGKLVGIDNIGAAAQGVSVALSADGNTAIVGGLEDNSGIGAAWVFIRNNGIWSQQAKLVGVGNTGASRQGFSVSLSADGNTAIIGGPEDNSGIGAAWVFIRNNGIWSQQAKLVGVGNTGASRQGISVSLSADGNTAVVGGNNDNNGLGAAWVFSRISGSWIQKGSKLVGTGSVGSARQGRAVSLSADGNYLIIGASFDNSGVGATWIFSRIGDSWVQQGGKLVGTGGIGITFQGISVSLNANGSTALIGGWGDNNGVGAAWVFTRTGNTWSQQGNKLIGASSVGAAGQGYAVSLSGDGNTAIIGGLSDNNDVGALWIFGRNNNVWAQIKDKVVATNRVGSAKIGQSVFISADASTFIFGGSNDNSNQGAAWIHIYEPPPVIRGFSPASGPVGSLVKIAGSNLSNLSSIKVGDVAALPISKSDTSIVAMIMPGSNSGAILVSTLAGLVSSASTFTIVSSQVPNVQQREKLVSSSAIGISSQGNSVAISADYSTAVVGAMNDNNNQGAAFIYVRNRGAWEQQAKLIVSGNVGNALAGGKVGISADGNTVVLTGEADNGFVGAAWVFVRSGSVWSQQAKLVGTGATGIPRQGRSVAISADGNKVIVGGWTDNNNQGAAWVFVRNEGVWSQQGGKLVGTGSVGSAQQGFSVSLSADGNTAIVGAHIDNSNQGAAWVYTLNNGAWVQQGNKLVGTGSAGFAQQGFSVSLSADGNTAAIGGNIDDSGNGAVWVFERVNGVWGQQGNKLVGKGSSAGFVQQGFSVSISADGNTIAFGGVGDSAYVGAVWLFKRKNGVWKQFGDKIVGTGNVGGSQQGASVSLSTTGEVLIYGGPRDNNGVGAAWLYESSPMLRIKGNLNDLSTTYGVATKTPSTFKLTAHNLKSNLEVIVPAGFEVSLYSDSIYSSRLPLSINDGFIDSLSVYVRLRSNTLHSKTPYTGFVTCISGDTIRDSIAIPPSFVSPSTLTITASDTTKTYGTAVVLQKFRVEGLVNNDSVDSVNISSIGSLSNINVGSYPIIASKAVGSGLSNYIITYIDGKLKVNPKTLSVRAIDTSKIYGTQVVLNKFSVQGLVGGDTINSVLINSLGAYSNATVGDYPIIISGASGIGLDNYLINYEPGILKVLPAVITVSALNQTKCEGSTFIFPANSFSALGLKNTDSIVQVTVNSAGSIGTASPGTYSINIANAVGVGLANYELVYLPGILTVQALPAAPVVTDNTVCVGGSAPTLSAIALSGHSLRWYGTNAVGGVSSNTAPVVSTSVVGVTDYYVSQVSGSGCESSRSKITVTVQALPAAPVFTINNSSQCLNENRFILKNISNATQLGIRYRWDFGDSSYSTALNPVISYSREGSYAIRLFAETSAGCSVYTLQEAKVVANPPAPTIRFRGDTICTSTNLLLSASSGLKGYQWFVNGSMLSGANDSLLNATRNGNYTVSIASLDGCRSAQSVGVTVQLNKIPPSPVVTNVFYCVGAPAIPLTATTQSGSQLLWYTSLTGGTATTIPPVPRTDSVSAQSYFVSQITNTGCESPRIQLTAFVLGPPQKPVINWNGSELQAPQGYSSYQWLLSNQAISGATQAAYKPLSAGVYRVRVTNAGGCADTSLVYHLLVTGIVSIPNSALSVIKAYPNPTADQLLIEFSRHPEKGANIRVVNGGGHVIQALFTRQKQQKIDMSKLPSGVYYIEVDIEKTKQTMKVLKN